MLVLELQMHSGFVPVISGRTHILFELWLLWASFSSSENAGSWSPREMTLPREGSSVPPLFPPCFPRKSAHGQGQLLAWHTTLRKLCGAQGPSIGHRVVSAPAANGASLGLGWEARAGCSGEEAVPSQKWTANFLGLFHNTLYGFLSLVLIFLVILITSSLLMECIFLFTFSFSVFQM